MRAQGSEYRHIASTATVYGSESAGRPPACAGIDKTEDQGMAVPRQHSCHEHPN